MKFDAYFEVILAAIIWGSTGAFVKYLQLPPTTMSFFRLAIPTLFLLVFFLIKKKPLFKGSNKMMFLASTLNAGRMFLYFLGFTLTSIGNAVIAVYTWPIFVTVLSIIFLKEHISKRNAALLVLSFIGMVFIFLNREFSFADKDFIGISAIVVSALIYAITVLIYKKGFERYSRAETLLYQNFVGALVFIPFLFFNPLPTMLQTSVATGYGAFIGLVGFGLFFSGLKQIRASTASVLTYVEVVSGILFGILLFKEVLEWNVIVGGALIIASTVFIKKDLPKPLRKQIVLVRR